MASIRLAFRVWARETANLLGVSSRALVGFGVLIVGLGVLMLVGGAEFLSGMTEGLTSTNAALLSRTLSHGVVLSAALLGGIFGLLAGDLSAMDTLVHLGGGSRSKRLALLVVPTMTIAAAAAWLATFPVIKILSSIATDGSRGVAVVVVALIVVTLVATSSLATHRLISKACRSVLPLPLVYANVVAFAVVALAFAALTWPTFSPAAADHVVWHWGPGGVLDQLVVACLGVDGQPNNGSAWLRLALAVVVLVGIAAALVWSSAPSTRNVAEQEAHAVYRVVRAPERGGLPLLAWYEALSLTRAPSTLMSLIGVVSASVLSIALGGHPIGSLALLAVATIAGSVGIHATGVNLRASWLLRTTVGKTWRLGAGKLLGALVVAVTLFVVGMVGPTIVLGPSPAMFLLIQVMLPTFVGSVLSGSLVPVDQEQPLTATMAGAVGLVVTGGGMLIISRILNSVGSGYGQLAAPVFLVLAVLMTIITIGQVHSESVVRRT